MTAAATTTTTSNNNNNNNNNNSSEITCATVFLSKLVPWLPRLSMSQLKWWEVKASMQNNQFDRLTHVQCCPSNFLEHGNIPSQGVEVSKSPNPRFLPQCGKSRHILLWRDDQRDQLLLSTAKKKRQPKPRSEIYREPSHLESSRHPGNMLKIHQWKLCKNEGLEDEFPMANFRMYI